MKISVAKNSGFCKGVEFAVNTALGIKDENTWVLGEIIHNADVVKAISDHGLKVAETLDEIPRGCTVIFRSHGVPKSYYDECAAREIKVIDCTCGFVRRTQTIVEEQSALGKYVIIVGEPEHPEVVGLLGWCGEALVLNDTDKIPEDIAQKSLCVVCQTTFSAEKFEKIVKNIKKVCKKTVAVFKTICYTTIERQLETEKLAKQCEAMLVIGGLNSSNTNKLYELAKMHCGNVFRMSNAEDLDYSKIKNYKSIGIVSGASTPNAQTREVLLKMEENTEVKATTNEMEDVLAKIDNESKFKKGQIVQATISQATDEGLQILLPFSKKEVALSKDELDCENYNADEYMDKIGEPIDLLVVELKPALKLSQKMIKMLAEEEALSADIEAGKEFSVVCTGTNKGGLVSQLGTYQIFVPAKEIRPGFVKDLTKYVGKTLRLRAIEIRKTGRKEIIASQRVILEAELKEKEAAKQAKTEEFFANIAVGDVVEGKVERATGFGAFVSVNGFDCLAHISDLSWTGTENVTDVLEIGKTYNFKVLKVDKENKKVSIGYKQLQPQPWDLVGEKYSVGDVIHGKVVRIVPFGAFVEVEKGIDGLVHVSQISYERIETPATVLNVGDEVDAKVIALDTELKKMNLSIKVLLPEPERKPSHKSFNESDDDEGGSRKPRASRRHNDDELSNWSEGSISVGTSLGDLIANAKKNK